eukprot:scaffold9005_cov53-Attheya_sp.AAC.2
MRTLISRFCYHFNHEIMLQPSFNQGFNNLRPFFSDVAGHYDCIAWRSLGYAISIGHPHNLH